MPKEGCVIGFNKRVVVVLLFSLLATAGTAAAQEAQEVLWHTDVESATREAVDAGRPLLLFVTAEDCRYCQRMRKTTYRDRAVLTVIREAYVPLLVDGRQDPKLAKKLGVRTLPTTFVIRVAEPNPRLVDRMDGYVEAPKFHRRLTVASQQQRTARK